LAKEENVIIIDQVITHHTKFNPEDTQTCSFKGTYQLRVQQYTA